MQHARPNRLRRAIAYAVLAALLGVVSLTLSQCTMVGDNLTGVSLSRSAPTSCIKTCNDLYDLLYKLERKKHAAENDLCQLLPAGQAKNDCLQVESARHTAAKDQLTDDKVACHNNCHHQGSASAG